MGSYEKDNFDVNQRSDDEERPKKLTPKEKLNGHLTDLGLQGSNSILRAWYVLDVDEKEEEEKKGKSPRNPKTKPFVLSYYKDLKQWTIEMSTDTLRLKYLEDHYKSTLC